MALNILANGKVLNLDANGNLLVNLAAGSISGGNAAASLTGAAVPINADYQGVNIGGNLVGVTGLSLGTSRAPTVAIVDGSGNQIVSFGGGSQFAMASAQSASALGTIALGYDGTNVRGLLTNASGHLNVIFPSAQAVTLTSTTITGTVAVTQSGTWNVTVNTALPAGTNVIGHVIIDSGSTTVVSGTVAVTQSGSWSLAANQSVNVAQINGVTPLMGNGVTGTGSQRVTIASDNTAFAVNATLQAGSAVIGHVIADTGSTTVVTGTVAVTQSGSWSLAANQSVNVAQINGVTPLMGNGVTGTGSQRVTIASDNTAFAVNATLQAGSAVIGHVIADTGSTTVVTGTVAVTQSGSWSLAANQSVNVAQINGVTPLMGNGVTGTGSQRVTIASDNTAFAVNATLQAGSAVIGHVIADTGSTTVVTGTVAVTQSGSWSLAANQSVNVAQINGVTPLMGNGVTGTGSQRVTIASDNTAFAVNATLQASSAVIGHVIVDSGSVTATVSGTVTANQGGAPWSQNITQIGGVALALGQTVKASSIPVVLPSDQAISVSNISVGTVGSPILTSATEIAGSDGFNLRVLQTDPLGKLMVSDLGGLSDIMMQMVFEQRALRALLTSVVTEGGGSRPTDFTPASFGDMVTSEEGTI